MTYNITSVMTIAGNRVDLVGTSSNLVPPSSLGLDENTRWVGSKVRLTPAIQEAMLKTYISEAPLGTRRNFETVDGSPLPAGLILWKNPAPDQEYIIVSTGIRKAHTVYERLGPREHDGMASMGYFVIHQALSARQTVNTPVDSTFCLGVPVHCVELLELAKADAPMPVMGEDYVEEVWTVNNYRFEQLDKSCDGFCNQPTAALAISVKSCAKLNSMVERIRTVKGRVTEKGFARLSVVNMWEDKFVSEEARYLDGYPAHRLEVNYKEIAEFFNQK